MRGRSRAIVGAAGWASWAVGLAIASGPVAASAAESARGRVIEEIVVTARGREEAVRNIPVAITAIDQEQIENYNLRSFEDLGAMVPQLNVIRAGSGSGAQINIRGIGSTPTSIGIEQSVAVILDGVYYPQGRVINEGVFDVQQVAVLKGPQALYFGKNATAGVISMRTNDPGERFEAIARTGYEFEQDSLFGEAILSLPITDRFGARLALRGTDMSEGYMTNAAGDTTYTTVDAATFATTVHDNPAPANDIWPKEESLYGRLTLQGRPTDRLTLTMKASYSEYENAGPTGHGELWRCPTLDGQPHTSVPDPAVPGANMPVPNPLAECRPDWASAKNPIPPAIARTNPLLAQFGGETGEDYTAESVTGLLEWSLDNLDLTAVLNYHDQETNWVGDFDGGGATGTMAGENNTFDNVSAEVRAVSTFGGAFNYVIGAYYQETEREFVQDVLFAGAENSAVANPKDRFTAYAKISETEGETQSIYAEILLDVTERLRLTAGARYLEETKDSFFLQPYVNPFFQGLFIEGERVPAAQTFSDVTPEVTLSFDPDERMTIYLAYKEGFKSGGFSNSGILATLTAPPRVRDFVFEPEEVSGFEGGVKASLLGDTLLIEMEAYTYDFEDLQIDFFNSPTFHFITENAGEAETDGAEVQVTWLPPGVEGLTLAGSLAYNDATYADFIAPCYAGQTPAAGCDIFLPGQVPKQQLAGTDRPLAPEWSGALRFDYQRALLAGWSLGLSGNLQYKDDYQASPFVNPFAVQDSYTTFDASVRLSSPDQRFEIAVIGKNLGDEHAMLTSGDTPSTGGNTGAPQGFVADQSGTAILPRTIAVRVGFSY